MRHPPVEERENATRVRPVLQREPRPGAWPWSPLSRTDAPCEHLGPPIALTHDGGSELCKSDAAGAHPALLALLLGDDPEPVALVNYLDVMAQAGGPPDEGHPAGRESKEPEGRDCAVHGVLPDTVLRHRLVGNPVGGDPEGDALSLHQVAVEAGPIGQ